MTGEDYYENPYESFMRKHLQHYGYYTGKNQNYKNQFNQYAEWEKNYAYSLSSDSSSDSDSDDDDRNPDGNLQDELLRTTQLIYSSEKSGRLIPHLREPRSLYALNKELGPQQAARWPSDLQVINEQVKHLQTLPSEPEPFYKTTGFEKSPMVRGEANGGRVVFCYETHSSFFTKSRVGGSRNGCEQCSVKLKSNTDTTLIFESRFESGNLGKAIQVGENEYELWLRYDLYTNKHTQWFYFRVSNTRSDREYRFTIVNFMKPESLYNDGMRPVVYSEKDAALHKIGWVRGGHDIKYYKNNLRYEAGKVDRSYYSLTWTTRFTHDHDTVYFSHCYPYTYTDLQDYLLELTNDPIKSRICKQRVLCQTLAGNLVYVLTITSPSQNPEDMKHKKAVVVTSRVHPGESNASWMMKGFLDFLTGNSSDAKLLRDTFIFKVVPMLNPDGVIVGNYRCSLAGRDLNRNYKTVLKDAYPSVWNTKTMIRKLLQERDIIVYCDLHGHSRRHNVFIYGCEQHHGSAKRFHERIFPFMLSKNTPEKFCFNSCKFKVHKSKESTGRVVMWNLGVMNSYTLEATFCGSSLGKMKGYHFNQSHFEMMGSHFCDTLLDYCDPDITKFLNILNYLEEKHRLDMIAKLARKALQRENGDSSDISSDTESSDGGSDSSASNGPPVHLQFYTARPKRKKHKSKKERNKVLKEKEDQKKEQSEQQDDKKVKNNQIKQGKQDSAKPQSQPVKYTSNTPKRPRSLDDRSNSGMPVFVQERYEQKQQRKNYLEALTAAYVSNNIPFVTDPAFVRLHQVYPRGQKDGGGAAPLPKQSQKSLAMATAGFWSPAVMTFVSQTGDSSFKISRLVGRREFHRSEVPFVEDILKTNRALPASFTFLDRRHKPHLLEISAAQQRQTEALSRDKKGPVKMHPSPFDENSESGKGPRKLSKVKSAQTSHSTITTLNSIQELQTSPNSQNKLDYKANAQNKLDYKANAQNKLDYKANEASGNGAARTYIQNLIEETKEEIQDLTNEIHEDVEKKQLHKVKTSKNRLTPHTEKSGRTHKQGTDMDSLDKMPTSMGDFKSASTSYFESSYTQRRRNSGNYMAKQFMDTPSTTAAKMSFIITSNHSRTAEPPAPTISPHPFTRSSELIDGQAAGNNTQRQNTIEEQARARNLRRQDSLNKRTLGAQQKGAAELKNIFSRDDLNGVLKSESSTQPAQFASTLNSEADRGFSLNISQLSSQKLDQSMQKSNNSNRIRSGQQNTVLQLEAVGLPTTTVGSLSHAKEKKEREPDVEDYKKILLQPKSSL
ncbi:hypothetical protein BsWGS_07225 [Bradybaena similaris]